jgi:hypothetical protein
MPEATTFRVTTYYKLARDEAGLTHIASQRVPASQALEWVLDELPEDAWSIEQDLNTDKVTISIDWSQVPDSIRYPKLPARWR